MNNQTTKITVISQDFAALDKAAIQLKTYLIDRGCLVKGPMKIKARYSKLKNGVNIKESRMRLVVNGELSSESIKGMEALPLSKNCNFSFSVEIND